MAVETQDWLRRVVWLACVCVYLVVFVGGVLAGASDLLAMLRAAGLSVATAILGRLALSVLGRAAQPAPEEPPMATQDGTLGSLLDLVSSPNVPEPRAEPGAL